MTGKRGDAEKTGLKRIVVAVLLGVGIIVLGPFIIGRITGSPLDDDLGFSIFLLILCGAIGAIIGVWLLFWHFLAVLSDRLHGATRRLCLVSIVVLLPAVLSLYFFQDASPLSLQGALDSLQGALEPSVNIGPLLGVAIVAYMSWEAGRLLGEATYPIRGFVVAATALFVMLLIGHHAAERQALYAEGEQLPSQTGEYGVLYITYTLLCYLAMLARMKRDRVREAKRR